MADMNKQKTQQSGQALVEYALIVTLVILGFAIALAATGPAIANVFRDTVDQVVAGDRLQPNETPLVALDFWNTMTAVASITPGEKPLPTRTPAPPTFTIDPNLPTNTFTPTVPTSTPTQTPTASSTPTQEDIRHVAPWTDTANDPKFWRLDNNLFVGQDDWYGQYYDNPDLDGAAKHTLYNRQLDASGTYRGTINFDWKSGGPINNFDQETFSVRWRRQILIGQSVSALTTLSFDIPTVDDGIRIWILGKSDDETVNYGGTSNAETALPGNCSSTNVTSGGTTSTGQIYDDAALGFTGTGNPPNQCLIVDRWNAGAGSYYNIQRTVKPGKYVIVVEYKENTGDARITVNMSSPTYQANPDDARIDNSGNEASGSPICKWANIREREEADSPEFSWDEYAPGNRRSENLPAGNRCYLELRGYVEIPTTMTDPVLTFWDFWNTGTGVRTWVEIADYENLRLLPNSTEPGSKDYSVYGSWTGTVQTYELHNGNNYNLNWTLQTIDLKNHPAVQTGGSRKVAIRFGISRLPSSGATGIRWWLDSIKLDNAIRGKSTPPSATGEFYTALSWNLNDSIQAEDFITSGQWALTSETNKTMGGDGMAWHESPGSNVISARNTFNNNNARTSTPDLRVHWLEFDGFINLLNPLGQTDEDGDTGDPILTFWHNYDVRRYTALRIQYTTDPYSYGNQANWQLVPGAEFVSIEGLGSTNSIFEPVTIRLKDIGVDRFRLRFAMFVHKDADRPPANGNGWYIDDIKLGRQDRPRFTDYPFVDTAEDPANLTRHWIPQGSWARVENGHLPPENETGNAYTDSPNGDYAPGGAVTNVILELKNPFDMRLDTPQNAKSPACNLGPLCETPGTVPDNPFMTFWWWRELGGDDHVFVEWKRREENNTSWKVLWAYRDRMTTSGGPAATYTETRVQLNWERVEIDMQPILNAIATNDPATTFEDDIVLRFRFEINTSTTSIGDGIYIDDIKVEEKVEDVWYLWPSGESRTDNTGAPLTTSSGAAIFGSGKIYSDSLENNPDLFTGGWHFGGNWSVINWMQKDGLLAFHDNATGLQSQAEPYHDQYHNLEPTLHDTFSVLEMNKIIDLRGVLATERPSLYFWTRYAIGDDDFARVQVSYEDPSLIGTLCTSGYAQCYEKQYGWSEWETLWQVENLRNLTWNRIQISLDKYAKTTNPGRRIRIRFVMSAYERIAQQDGWYIDAITVRHFDPGRNIVIRPGSSLFDGARNLNNWLTEGKWGLDPEFYYGTGGGPASLGSSTWNYSYWNMKSPSDRCAGINSDIRICADRFLTETGTARARRSDNPTGIAPTNAGIVLDINNEWGNGGPFGMSNNFVGRWELTSGIVGVTVVPGVYTFIGASDDGQRLRYVTDTGLIPGPCSLPGSAAAGDDPLCGKVWNIIDDWNYHGRTVMMGTARLAAAGASIQIDSNGDGVLENAMSNSTGRYRFILEYFEGTGGAVMTLSTGSNSFSFSDSPKQGVGLLFPDVEAVPRSSSSLILNGSLDLSQAVRPYIQYYTVYELGGFASVEVSTDGGFSWTQNGLTGALPPSFWSGQWAGNYYANKTISGGATPLTPTDNIDYTWGGNPPFSGALNDNFSMSWTRTFTIPNNMTIKFRTTADDGVRLWLNYPGGAGCADGNGVVTQSGQATTNGGNRVFTTGCLMIDNWRNQGTFTAEVDRPLTAGTYTLRLDYFENNNTANIKLDVIPPGFNSPTYSGTNMPDPTKTDNNWLLRTHDLAAYAGQKSVVIRFRLNRQGVAMRDEGRDPQNTTVQTPIDWRDSWWFSNITVADGG
jgi:hypothetical protein